MVDRKRGLDECVSILGLIACEIAFGFGCSGKYQGYRRSFSGRVITTH